MKDRKLVCLIFTVAQICLHSKVGMTEEHTTASRNGAMRSLTESEPGLLHTAMRYPKFYGDANTIHGGVFDRSHLLGSLGGIRDAGIDYGIYANVSVTQFFQGNLSGGQTGSNSPKVNGSADYWGWLDTGKAGLWPSGVLFLHGESSWRAGETINDDVGSLLPANSDARDPDPTGSNTALSEVYLMQAFPGNLLGAAGKQNLADFADTNSFANNERTQFQYTGLVNNPIVGSFVPLTMLMGLIVMRMFDIELERVSIASAIIALGMLVDNGIVIAEDIRSRLERGEDRRQACIDTGRTLSIPLLTSSLTTILAFLPMLLLDGQTGEYAFSLPMVVSGPCPENTRTSSPRGNNFFWILSINVS